MLSEAELKTYSENGFVNVPAFFNEKEVNALQLELERFKSEGLGHDVNPKTGAVNYQVMPLHEKSDLMRALLFNDRVLACIRQLVGSDDVYRWLDQIFLKPAKHGSGTEWHQDNAYFKIEDPRKGMGMWIAIHDASRENGTMEMIPNSESVELEYAQSTGSDHHITAQNVDETGKVYVETAAGGCVFFNFGILHCTRANTTDKERAGLAYHFVAQEAAKASADGKAHPAHVVIVSGRDCSGGENEYGVRVAGTWDAEVEKVIRR